MNFKAQHKQNQRIENITVHHLVFGVDIAQEVHVASTVSFASHLAISLSSATRRVQAIRTLDSGSAQHLQIEQSRIQPSTLRHNGSQQKSLFQS